eukprot:2795424-Rhodomonas_salina.2
MPAAPGPTRTPTSISTSQHQTHDRAKTAGFVLTIPACPKALWLRSRHESEEACRKLGPSTAIPPAPMLFLLRCSARSRGLCATRDARLGAALAGMLLVLSMRDVSAVQRTSAADSSAVPSLPRLFPLRLRCASASHARNPCASAAIPCA